MRIKGLLIIATVTLTGCAPRASEGQLDSPNPASRLYAIRRAGAERDWNAVPALVEQLDSDDPAVRVFSIQALERITGRPRGEYDPYAPLLQRQAAIDTWRRACLEWKQQGRVPAQAAHAGPE